MHDHARAALGLAHDLVGPTAPEDHHAAVLARLHDLFPCDQVFWTRTDFARGRAVVRGDETCADDMAQRLGEFGTDHPGIVSYVRRPSDLAPRRVSDVVDQRRWHGSASYAEVFSELGPAHQLSMVTRLRSSHVGLGWTLTRSGSDFTDDDVDLAAHVLPVLTALEPLEDHLLSDGPAPGLTRREQEVLLGLAEGRTGSAIAHHLGITERTVRKHLASIYDTLGCHDRLLAVERARQVGLLPPGSRPAR